MHVIQEKVQGGICFQVIDVCDITFDYVHCVFVNYFGKSLGI